MILSVMRVDESSPPVRDVVPAATTLANAARLRLARRDWLFAAAGVLGLTLLFALANWHWLRANGVTYGWDRMDHLITSLVYNDMVRSWSAHTPFDLLSYSGYYPPLFHYGIVSFYRIFGVDEDVAAMVNVLYLAFLLGGTYSITRRLAGRWTALLAAFVVGAFPMIFSMSRYLYIDFALTGMVALALALLLATERFGRRPLALWFGVGLGAALLVKWTTVAFVAAPFLYVVWRSGMLVALVKQPRLLIPRWRSLALAFVGGAGISALLLFPARDAVAQTWLGWWLWPLLSLFLAGAIYAIFATRPAPDEGSQRLKNALSAAAIAAWLMSVWYGINPEFVDYFAFTAYGRDEQFMAFGKYFGEVTTEQIGIVFSVLFLLVAIVWLWQQRGRLGHLVHDLSDTGWVLLLWVVVPYFIFSFRVTLAHTRYVVPFLPPFAIWIAVGLTQWRPRWLRAVAISGVVIFGSIQFAVISFDELAGWRPAFVVPINGQPVNLLAHGFSIQYPASERTDPGFVVAPPVLALVEQARQREGRAVMQLGLLVNSYQLHEKHFLYQIYKNYPKVLLRELARNWNDQQAYNQLFEMDYVLASDTHDFRTHKESQAAAARIVFDPNDAFNQAFRPVQAWTMPNGETVTLYTRRFAPTEPGVATEDYLALLGLFGDRLGAGDAVVLTSPDQVYMLGLSLPADAGATIAPLPMDGATSEQTIARLADLARTHNRIFLVSHNADQADPSGEIEGWLRANAVVATDLWANSIRVTPFVPVRMGTRPLMPANAVWPSGLQLESATVPGTDQPAGPAPGGALVVALDWTGRDATPRKASLQLLSAAGTLVAQEDRDLTSDHQEFVLLIPRAAAPGEYRLTLALYDPVTLQRFAAADGADVVDLGAVRVAPVQESDAQPLPELRHPNQQDDEGN